MIKYIKTFWNDDDGLSITDFLSCVVIISFAIINMITIFYLTFFTENTNLELATTLINLLKELNYPVCIVLTGYFGGGLINKFKKSKD